jgi:hypothetical protein
MYDYLAFTHTTQHNTNTTLHYITPDRITLPIPTLGHYNSREKKQRYLNFSELTDGYQRGAADEFPLLN